MSPISCKDMLGIVSIILTIVAYIPYFNSLVRQTTKPHIFSWILWAMMNGIAFAAQYTCGAGPGAWATGFTAVLSIVVIIYAVRSSEKYITHSDWIAFIGAFLAIILWQLTHDPLWSVILISLIDLMACYPTIRKSYNRPWQEAAMTYGICGIRSMIAIAALTNYTIVTTLYPISMVLSNGLLTIVLVWRRSVISEAA